MKSDLNTVFLEEPGGTLRILEVGTKKVQKVSGSGLKVQGVAGNVLAAVPTTLITATAFARRWWNLRRADGRFTLSDDLSAFLGDLAGGLEPGPMVRISKIVCRQGCGTIARKAVVTPTYTSHTSPVVGSEEDEG